MIDVVQLRGFQSTAHMLILYKWVRSEDQAKLRNNAPIHGVSSPKVKFRRADHQGGTCCKLVGLVTGMQFREINWIVSVHTCSPEMPGLFSLQIYFCLYGVIWGRHPLRQSRLGALGACWREFRNVSFDVLPPMEIQAVRLGEIII